MKYEAPQIAVVARAAEFIQSGDKAHNQQIDMEFAPTIGAYEADE